MTVMLPSRDPLGVKAAAAAAFGEIPAFAGSTVAVVGVRFGVKAGDSTLSAFRGLQLLSC